MSNPAASLDRGLRPPLMWLPWEPLALAEYAMLPWLHPLLARAPRGDGHPVLVLPGFLAGDGSTAPMRRYLARRGYETRAWELGRNLGVCEGLREQLLERLAAIHHASGRRRVSLIGWSLGGIYAREMARELPQYVRQVVSLGSPLYGNTRRATNAWLAYRLVRGREAHITDDYRGYGAPPVPTTSVFSRRDGVVAWKSSIELPGPQVQNVETYGTHTGLGFNALVLWLLADRLAQPEDAWKPFEAPRSLRHFYRTPS